MRTPTMADPKALLNAAIDAAFAREKINGAKASRATKGRLEIQAAMRQRAALIGRIVAGATMLGAVTTVGAVMLTRRARRIAALKTKTRMLFGKPLRRFGYGRYHLGRFGTAYIAYTYKLPEVRYRVPQLRFKAPTIHLKLPVYSH